MNSEKWQKMKEVFNGAVDLPVLEKESFLAVACADDEEMRQELRKMLEATEDADALGENAFQYLDDEKIPALPDKIGSYKVIREIGRGGMGVVYEAVRITKDFTQKVALKVIKRGMDTDAILSRFRHEQQILATLVHPNIARFLDGGMTTDGLAFYAMEYIEGEPLDDFSRKHSLDINERLELFREVCAAVQFAHKNFVIHRDLKPSNILVTEDGTPKLLDFGIAKILSDDFDSVGTATALGMMTPAYASPEQVRGERVNTATDIYSLGVIFCELLTERKPYHLPSNNQPALIKAICESEPIRPSDVWRDTGRQKDGETEKLLPDTQPLVTSRQLIPASQLRGDLDNIVLKALRKEPENRYASVEQFSEDIHRYLTGLPIAARRSTLRYRVSKFIRRNRLAVVAGLLIFASLVAGIAVASWQAVQARMERRIAERRFNDVRQLANNVVFKYHDAIASLPGSTAVREMLVKDAIEYLDNLSQDAQDNPALAQELALSYLKIANVQGETYRANLGDSQGALNSYRKSVGLLQGLTERDPKNTEYRKNLREAYQSLAFLLVRREDWKDAEATAKKQFQICQTSVEQEPENPDYRAALARSYQVLGDAAEFSGGYEENIKLYRLSLAEARNLIAKDPTSEVGRRVLTVALQRVGTRLEYYAKYLEEKGEPAEKIQPLYAEAEQMHRSSVDVSHSLKRDFPQSEVYSRYISATEINLGTALARVGRGTEGIPLIEKSIGELKKTAAADPENAEAKRDVAEGWQYLAFAYVAMGKGEKAIQINRESLKILEEITTIDPSNFEFLKQTHLTYVNTGDVYFKEGKLAEALALYQKSLNYAAKMAEVNQSPQIIVLRSESNGKVGKTYLAMAGKNKTQAMLESARSNLAAAREQLLGLQERQELGKNYQYKLNSLQADLDKTNRLM